VDEDGEVLLVLRREAPGAPWGLLAEDGESVAVTEAGQAVVKVASFSWYSSFRLKAKGVMGVVERALGKLPLREVEQAAFQARPPLLPRHSFPEVSGRALGLHVSPAHRPAPPRVPSACPSSPRWAARVCSSSSPSGSAQSSSRQPGPS
jgi:hypothetical protein